MRATSCGFVSALALLTVCPAPAAAQRLEATIGARKLDAAEPELLLAYALEEFFRDSDPSAARFPADAGTLRAFLKDRRDVVEHVLAKELGTDKSRGLRDPYASYRSLLTDLAACEKVLTALEATYLDGLRAIVLNAQRAMKTKQDDARVRILTAAAEGLRGAGDLEDRMTMALFSAGIQSQIEAPELGRYYEELQRGVRRDSEEYERTNLPPLKRACAAERAAYEKNWAEYARAAGAGVAQWANAAGAPGAKRKWQPAQIAFSPRPYAAADGAPNRTADPFPALQNCRVIAARLSPTGPVPSSGQIAAALSAAKQCNDAQAVLPAVANPFYAHVRALFSWEAGTVAHRAAARLEVDRGFLAADPDLRALGYESFRAWNTLYRLSGRTAEQKTEAFYHLVMARAYEGKRFEANDLLAAEIAKYRAPRTRRQSVLFDFRDPKAWFDFARVCAAKPFSRQQPEAAPDVASALNFLQFALAFDAVPAAVAADHPDFNPIARGKSAAGQQQFRAVIEGVGAGKKR